jgi:hypothetical protein
LQINFDETVFYLGKDDLYKYLKRHSCSLILIFETNRQPTDRLHRKGRSLRRTGLNLSISAKSFFYLPAFEISSSCRTASGYYFDANNCRLPTFDWVSVAETVHAPLVSHGLKGEVFHKYLINYLPIEGFEL